MVIFFRSSPRASGLIGLSGWHGVCIIRGCGADAAEDHNVREYQVAELAAEYGVMLVRRGDEYFADAPTGFRFRANDCHSLTVEISTHGGAVGALAEDLECGLIRCEDEDCEACEEGLSFDELHALFGGERLA